MAFALTSKLVSAGNLMRLAFDQWPDVRRVINGKCSWNESLDGSADVNDLICKFRNAIQDEMPMGVVLNQVVDVAFNSSSQVNSGFGFVLLSILWERLSMDQSTDESGLVVDRVLTTLFPSIKLASRDATVAWLDALVGMRVVSESESYIESRQRL